MAKMQAVTSRLGMRQLTGNYADVAARVSPIHQGLEKPLTKDAERNKREEEVAKDLHERTPFFNNPGAQTDWTNLANRLSNPTDYPYVQGDFDGGGLTEPLLKILLFSSPGFEPSGNSEDYLTSIRICYLNEDNEPSALSLCWLNKNPATMIMTVISGLDRPPPTRSCSVLFSQDCLKLMRTNDQYSTLVSDIEQFDPIPADELLVNLETKIAQTGLSSLISNLLEGQPIKIPLTSVQKSDDGYQRAARGRVEEYHLKPPENAEDLFIEASNMMMNAFNSGTQGDVEGFNSAEEAFLQNIFSQGYAKLLENIDLSLKKQTPPDQNSPPSAPRTGTVKEGAFRFFKDKYSQLVAPLGIRSAAMELPGKVKTIDSQQTAQGLGEIVNQLIKRELDYETASKLAHAQLENLKKDPRMQDLANQYQQALESLGDTVKAINELNANYRQIKMGS